MADAKVSALTALTGAGTADNDVLPIVDTSANASKKITVAEFTSKVGIGGTAVNLTGLADGDGLVYDSGASEFVVANALAITPGTPSDGDVLTYDSGTSTYGPASSAAVTGDIDLAAVNPASTAAWWIVPPINPVAGAQAAGDLCLYPIVLSHAAVIDQVAIEVTTTAASSTFTPMVYTCDGTSLTALITGSAIDTSTGAAKTQSVADVTLPANQILWVGGLTLAGAPSMRTVTGSPTFYTPGVTNGTPSGAAPYGNQNQFEGIQIPSQSSITSPLALDGLVNSTQTGVRPVAVWLRVKRHA